MIIIDIKTGQENGFDHWQLIAYKMLVEENATLPENKGYHIPSVTECLGLIRNTSFYSTREN